MDSARAEQIVSDTLTVEFEVDASKIVPSARLREDLGLDSLDGVDLIVAIEKLIGHPIAESEARKMKTVGDLHRYLQSSRD